MTTKVTPAYPGKIKCAPPIPYEVCVQVLNGQIDEAGLRRLGLATDGKFEEYAKAATRYGSFGGYGSTANLYGYANSGASSYGYANSGASSSAYGYGASSSRASSNVETVRGLATSQRSGCDSNDFGDDPGTELSLPPLAQFIQGRALPFLPLNRNIQIYYSY